MLTLCLLHWDPIIPIVTTDPITAFYTSLKKTVINEFLSDACAHFKSVVTLDTETKRDGLQKGTKKLCKERRGWSRTVSWLYW
jgi:hypothetical protein